MQIKEEEMIRESKNESRGSAKEARESLMEGSKTVEVEGVKWHKGVQRWNHNAERLERQVI